MRVANSTMLRVVFVAAALVSLGSCENSSGGGSGGDTCGSGECKLVASDGSIENIFGYAVAISGDDVVVGAELNDEAGELSGAAYVFRRDGTRYEQVQKLFAQDPQPGDRFGTAVAIDGDVLVVGALTATGGPGAAFVYRLVDGVWTFEDELAPFFGAADGGFGRAVAISGNRIVVGSYRDNVGPGGLMKTGSAYTYQFNAMTNRWGLTQKLSASDRGSGDLFGVSVAIDGDVIAIGANGEEIRTLDFQPPGNPRPPVIKADTNSGAVYVFKFNGTNFVQVQKIKAQRRPLACETQTFKDDYFLGDRFGTSLDVQDGRIVIGADSIETRVQNAACGLNVLSVGNNAGAVYVYRETAPSSGVWTFEVKLEPSDISPQKLMGRSVAIDGSVIIAGARGDSGAAVEAGAAYLFSFDGTNWSQDRKLTASDAEMSDFLGQSVAIDGEAVVVGAHGDDDRGSLSGAAYVFGM